MTNVTPINRHQQAIADGRNTGRLTSAHRCAIARIQELAIDVSQRTDQYIFVEYAGHIHTLAVRMVPCANVDANDCRAEWSRSVRLPPNYYCDDRSLRMLGEIIVHLESLLPNAGGVA